MMLSPRARDSPRLHEFFGALGMNLGSHTFTGAARSGSPLASTRPHSATPMEDARNGEIPSEMDLNMSAFGTSASSRRGNLDGNGAVRHTRHRSDISTSYAVDSDSASSSQESPSSLSQIIRAPRQALSGVISRFVSSQFPSEGQDQDVHYPVLPSLIQKEASMPGAFPESPQKGRPRVELPSPEPERPIPNMTTLVIDSRDRGSPFSRASRSSTFPSVASPIRSPGSRMDENMTSPRPQTLLDHTPRFAPSTSRFVFPDHLSADFYIPDSTSNEPTPRPRPRTLDTPNVRSPPLRREVVIEPAGYDVDTESDVPTRPVTPEAYPPRPGPFSIQTPLPVAPGPSTVQQPPPVVEYNRRGISRDLEERFPIIVAHSPRHQALWDRLPFGTLYTVARLAGDLRIDLETLDSSDLQPLIGRNITMERVEEVLRRARGEDWVQVEIPDENADKQLKNVVDELDWEAEQIVNGTGEMLGWREERGTRYGGKVQFAATLRLNEEISGKNKSASNFGPMDLHNFGRITLEAPSIRGSSLFTRTFGSHHFLRVRISKKIQTEYSVWCRSSNERNVAQKQTREWSQRPIFILGRIYSFFREKDDVNFYFLEGPERVGEAFDNGRRGYGLPECTSVYQLIDWWSPFRYNGGQDWTKLCTRLELGLSDTLPGMFIAPENIEVAPDIMNDRLEFTDGAGLMTPSVARSLLQKYGDGTSHQLYPAYQIRIHTAKGVLLVDPASLLDHENYNTPHRLKLYQSMCKSKRGGTEFRRGPVHGFHILDAACCILCVVKPAPSSSTTGARLSSQFITILADRGVPSDTLLRMQSDALKKELAVWTEVGIEEYHDTDTNQKSYRIDENTRIKLARTIGRTKALHLMVKKREVGGAAKGLGYGRSKKRDRMDELEEDEEDEESSADDEPPGRMAVRSFESFASVGTVSGKVKRSVDPWMTNEISGLPALKSQQLQFALLAGIDVARCNWFHKIWVEIARTAMLGFVTKFHVPVERSASGFLQPDPTGFLEEGEICFTSKEAMVDSITGIAVTSVVGEVIVGRHPALLPTDMRKVTARAIPALRYHPGIIFCSVKGSLPLAHICAGGDYDGDEAMVIWDRAIVEPFRNADVRLRLPPEGFEDRFDRGGPKTNEIERQLRGLEGSELSIQLTKYLVGSVAEGSTFKIYNSFSNMATYRDGLQGYWTPDGRRIETSSSRIMGHTFNYLMDSRKTGVRIKPEVLAQDKQQWSIYEEPYWLRRQKSILSSALSKQNQKPLRPLDGQQHILDQLVLDGEAELSAALQRLQEKLRPSQRGGGELYFDGKGTDGDLAHPWRAAEGWARGHAEREIWLKRIREGVVHCQDRFRKLNIDSARKLTTSAQRRVQLREICQEFAGLGVAIDGGVMYCPWSDESLRFAKASCAYVCDANSTNRGGSDNGFAWHVAMRDLCMMKAKAIGSGSTFTVSLTVMEKMDVHRHWA